jgi:hypothetical protein
VSLNEEPLQSDEDQRKCGEPLLSVDELSVSAAYRDRPDEVFSLSDCSRPRTEGVKQVFEQSLNMGTLPLVLPLICPELVALTKKLSQRTRGSLNIGHVSLPTSCHPYPDMALDGSQPLGGLFVVDAGQPAKRRQSALVTPLDPRQDARHPALAEGRLRPNPRVLIRRGGFCLPQSAPVCVQRASQRGTEKGTGSTHCLETLDRTPEMADALAVL